MNKRRNVLTLVSVFLLPLLLFHFQNCAPASGSASGDTSTGSGQARLVEDLNKTQLQFVTTEVEVQDDVPATGVDGLCNRDHNGAQLNWSVSTDAVTNGSLVKGQALCDHGQFTVAMKQLDQMVCGVSHLLVVEAEWGASTFTHITRRCQPLASRPVAPPADSPMGTTCNLEYSPASAAPSPCLQVCYRDSKVILAQSLDLNQCSTLAAGLAGTSP